MKSQDEDIPRYLPAPGHDQPCLGGGLSDLDPRGRHRGPLRRQLRHHPCFGRPGRPGGGLPRHCHGDLRVAPLRYRRGRQLSGSRRLGLTPRGRLSSSSRGIKYPLGLPPPPLSQWPLGGWLDGSWPNPKLGLRPRRAAMSSSSSSSPSSSSSSGVSGDGSLGSPSLSCRRRSFSKASRARLRSRARAFSASFFFFSSAATRRAARSAASCGTRGREDLCHPTS
jgi:hypothetical protein